MQATEALGHLSFTDIKKKHFAMFDFLVKIKLVSTVVHINATTLNKLLCIGIASFVAFLWKNQFSEWCLMLSLNVPKNSKIKFASFYVWNWTVLIVWAIFLSETSGT